MNDPQQRLLAMLQEDMGEEAEDFLPLVQQINALPQPEPLRSTAHLMAQVQPISWWERLNDWTPLLILRSQVRVVGREIWAASAIVLIFGTLVTLLGESQNVRTLPLTILAPMVTAAGIALLYDDESDRRLEIEAASPLGVSLLMLARLTLLFSFDLSIALGCSLLLAAVDTGISFTPLILAWLLPMTFLSTLAFFLSVYTHNAPFGVVISLVIWGLHVVLSQSDVSIFLVYVFSLPGLADPATRPVLVMVSGLLLGCGLWILNQHEHRFAQLTI